MLKRKDYPKELLIGDQVYKIKFVRKFADEQTVGECDPSSLEIRILCGQGSKDTLKTFIHEVCHALIEFEHDIEIKHKMIYALEEPIFKFFCDNFLWKRRR